MDWIRQLRTERGLSQAKLAVMADMDPATLNRLERGTGNPNLKTLQRIADALDISVAELLEDVSPKARAARPLEPSLNDALADERQLEDEAALAVLFRSLARRARRIVERSRREGPSAELSEDAAALYADATALYGLRRLRARSDIFGTGSEELADAVDAYVEVEGTIQAMLRQDVEATDEERDTARRFRPGTDNASKHREADAS
jgi:transcriptional regulator with XRE-family HTH domain